MFYASNCLRKGVREKNVYRHVFTLSNENKLKMNMFVKVSETCQLNMQQSVLMTQEK